MMGMHLGWAMKPTMTTTAAAAEAVVDSSAVLLDDDNDNHQQLTIAICSQSIIHVRVSSSTQFANAEMKKGTSVSRS